MITANKTVKEITKQIKVEGEGSLLEVNKSGLTPLHHAGTMIFFIYCGIFNIKLRGTAKSREDIVKQLLSYSIIEVDQKDFCGLTPLHWAAQMGNFNSCKLLLQKGNASVLQVSTDGATALHYLVRHAIDNSTDFANFCIIFSWILERGFHLNTQDCIGNTILHYVIFFILFHLSSYL